MTMNNSQLVSKVRSRAGKLYWRKIGMLDKGKYVNFPYGKSTYSRSARDAVLETLQSLNVRLPLHDIWKIQLFIWHGDTKLKNNTIEKEL